MQLTRYTDYALRVLIYLAHKEDALSTINEISEAYGISENHVMKIVHDLAKLGYIATMRGKGGGMRLARPPDAINLGEVVRNTEETLSLVECLAVDYQGGCRLLPSCRLKGVLKEARDVFLKHLDQYTLQDVIGRRGQFVLIQMHPRQAASAAGRGKARRLA